LLLASTLLASPAGAETTESGDEAAVDVAAGLGPALNLLYRGTGEDPKNKDRLDIYRPKTDAPAPVVMFVHGGGLVQGDKQLYARLGEYLSAQGFVAVVPNHRLSPDVSHPAHVEDIVAAFAWVHANVARHGGDPSRILVMGHSAGAYLAALMGMDPRYLAKHGLTASSIRAVVPISGFFHVERIAVERPKTVWGSERATWLEASPARYVRRDVPPMLLLYAQNDTKERRQESLDLAAALRAAGHDRVETAEIPERDHTSIIARFGQDDDATAARVVEFARRALAP